MTLISVIVPCYNQAQYLDECLQSVLDQTYENWECIIVNDGSPDNTEEVAKRWVEKDARFKYLHQVNKGVSAARNFGISNAQGEWILPLDADDKISSQYLRLASKEFHKDYSLIFSNAQFFGDVNDFWQRSDFTMQELLINNKVFNSSFYTKERWRNIGGYDSNFRDGFEDWDFWINLLSNETYINVKKLDYVCFYYRRKESSRDADIIKSSEKLAAVENTLYCKYNDLYINYLPTLISSLRDLKEMNNKYTLLQDQFDEDYKRRNKNFLTKTLSRIIYIISR